MFAVINCRNWKERIAFERASGFGTVQTSGMSFIRLHHARDQAQGSHEHMHVVYWSRGHLEEESESGQQGEESDRERDGGSRSALNLLPKVVSNLDALSSRVRVGDRGRTLAVGLGVGAGGDAGTTGSLDGSLADAVGVALAS